MCSLKLGLCVSWLAMDGANSVLRAMGTHGIFRVRAKRWRKIVGMSLVGAVSFLVTELSTIVIDAVVFLAGGFHFLAQKVF